MKRGVVLLFKFSEDFMHACISKIFYFLAALFL